MATSSLQNLSFEHDQNLENAKLPNRLQSLTFDYAMAMPAGRVTATVRIQEPGSSLAFRTHEKMPNCDTIVTDKLSTAAVYHGAKACGMIYGSWGGARLNGLEHPLEHLPLLQLPPLQHPRVPEQSHQGPAVGGDAMAALKSDSAVVIGGDADCCGDRSTV